jgi:signal transduction histidine kinase
MAAGIAHEVRNPLAAVRSMVQLVRDETVPFGDRNRLLDNVVTEVDRVNRVLSGMLALGRPTAARDERTDLAALATDAVSFCQAYAKQRGEIIQASFSESLWVQGDPHELRQVLVNLLLNACQASEAGQTILVDGASKAELGYTPQVVIRIMDSGEGMPRSVLDQAFEPFFTTKQDGGGLGLSICRDAVRRHGGSITIASELHVGTIVSVELPQAPNASNPGR